MAKSKKVKKFTASTAPVRTLDGADQLVSFMSEGNFLTNAQGMGYIASQGEYYIKPVIDATTIYHMSKNNYVTEHVRRLKSLLFITPPKLTVYDPNDNEVDDLSDELMAQWDHAEGWVRIQQAWVDMFTWGCFLVNVVYAQDGPNRTLDKMRRLPPESFALAPLTANRKLYSHILKGITLDDAGNLECWQTQNDNQPHLLKNVTLLKDPTSGALAGESSIAPIVPVVRALNLAWQAQQQKLNRIGAPILFLKWLSPPVQTGTRDDVALAKAILQNWGRGVAFQLRDNMELVKFEFNDNQAALTTIEALERRLRDYFSPATLLKQEGGSLGDSGGAKLDLVNEWIRGEHNLIEGLFEKLLQDILEQNAFVGYLVEIEIPEPTPDRQLTMAQAEAGYRTKALFTNEIRTLLGQDELDDEELEELREEYKSQMPPSPFGIGGLPGRGIVPGKEKEQSEAEKSFHAHHRPIEHKADPDTGEEVNDLEYALIEADRKLTEDIAKALAKERPVQQVVEPYG